MLHVMPFWVWILCCRLWFSEKIWHITLYLEIQKGRQSADRSQFIASACFLICINLTGLTHTETHQKKRQKKKRVWAEKRWECIAWTNKISLCPRHQQYHIKQADLAAEDNFSSQRTIRSDVNGGYQVKWEIFLSGILTLSTLQCSRDMSLKSVNDKHAFYASVFGSVFFDIGNLSLTNIEYAPGRLHVHIFLKICLEIMMKKNYQVLWKFYISWIQILPGLYDINIYADNDVF